jgi:Holliday junction resolvase RusA-like endonuclease
MWNRRGKTTFKSADYLQYQNDIRDQLIGTDWPFGSGQVSFNIIAGLSNRGADLDNVIKPILDTYQGVYEEFNDNKVYNIKLEKRIVKRGGEFLDIRIREYESDQATETQQETGSELQEETKSSS